MRAQLELDVHSELEERLRFETLLADISARFVNVPASQVDQEIEDAQRAICECLGVEHSSLWQVSPADPKDLLLTHLYRDATLTPREDHMSGSEFFPWMMGRLLSKEVVSISDTAKGPPEAARDLATWQHFHIKSAMAIPLSAGGGPIFGVLSFDATHNKRDWPEALQKRLQLLAQVFANALDRKNADQKLRESEVRLNLAADSANAGLWTLDPAGEVWATTKTFELFGIPEHEGLDFAKVLRLIHPEDRGAVHEIIHEALKSGNDSSAEYRIIRPDGNIRWLASYGRRYSRSGAEPYILMGVTIDVTESRRVRQENTEFAGRLLNAQEAESARIARELHDDLGQSIALFAVQLHKATMLVQSKLPSGNDVPLADLRKKISLIARHVSTLSHQLHSSELEFLGLAVAASALCREVAEQYGVTVNFTCELLPERLASDIELCLFRVLQEALRNFARHSNGKKAEVRIGIVGQNVQLIVSDDGNGFDSGAPPVKVGLGLTSMGERVRLVGGELIIRSRPGQGTVVEVRVRVGQLKGQSSPAAALSP
jgi:PAS domain S-box-containing protein